MVKPRVAVAIDFSDGAAIATAEAKRIAEQLSAELAVVHVAPGPPSDSWWHEQDREGWMTRAGLEPGTLVMRYGVPWVELLRFAKETRPVLLVAGSHGCSGFQPLATGSTVGRLSVMSAVPLMIVSPATLRWTVSERELDGRGQERNWSAETNDTIRGST